MQGPVVQSIVSLTSLLVVKMLTVLVSTVSNSSDLIIPGLVTNRTAKICCGGLILALFYSTMVIKNYFGQ